MYDEKRKEIYILAGETIPLLCPNFEATKICTQECNSSSALVRVIHAAVSTKTST